MLQYLYMMMTSWAIVCDVWYLPPMTRKPGESAVDFANRVSTDFFCTQNFYTRKSCFFENRFKNHFTFYSGKIIDCKERWFGRSRLGRAAKANPGQERVEGAAAVGILKKVCERVPATYCLRRRV